MPNVHRHSYPLIMGTGKLRGYFLVPDVCAHVHLNPVERTLLRLFIAHPEGIKADDLLLYWNELCTLYASESCFDDNNMRENAMESLCSESKKIFYSNVSRIKNKFTAVLGSRKAAAYIIKRDKEGRYKTRATMSTYNSNIAFPSKA